MPASLLFGWIGVVVVGQTPTAERDTASSLLLPPLSFHCFYYSDCGIPIIYFAFLFQGIFKFQRSSQLYSREVTINSSLHLPISLISIYLYFLHCSSLCFFYWFLSFHSAPFQNFISITSNIILAEKRDVNAVLIFLLFIKM